MTDIPNLYTIKQFCEKHTAFALGGVRDLIFKAKHNLLQESGAIVRVGRRVYIDEDRFFAWLRERNK